MFVISYNKQTNGQQHKIKQTISSKCTFKKNYNDQFTAKLLLSSAQKEQIILGTRLPWNFQEKKKEKQTKHGEEPKRLDRRTQNAPQKTWGLLYYVFTYYYSLLIDKDLYESSNPLIKFPCALLCSSILFARVPLFIYIYAVVPYLLCVHILTKTSVRVKKFQLNLCVLVYLISAFLPEISSFFSAYRRQLEQKYLESFEMWYWRRMEKIKWSEKVTNEQVLEPIVEKRTLINNILRRKASWISHILK